MPFFGKTKPVVFNNKFNFNATLEKVRTKPGRSNPEPTRFLEDVSIEALETFNSWNSDQKRSFMMYPQNRQFLFNHIGFNCRQTSPRIILLAKLAAKNLDLAEKTLELLEKHNPKRQQDFLDHFFSLTKDTPGQFTSPRLFELTRDNDQKKEFQRRLEKSYQEMYLVLNKPGQKLICKYERQEEDSVESIGFRRTSKHLRRKKIEKLKSDLLKLDNPFDRTIEENNNELRSEYEFMIRALQESNDLTGIAYIKMYTDLMETQTKYPIFVKEAIFFDPKVKKSRLEKFFFDSKINKRLEKEIRSIKSLEELRPEGIKALVKLALIRPPLYQFIKENISNKEDQKSFEWAYSCAYIQEQAQRLNTLKENVGIESMAYCRVKFNKNNQKRMNMAIEKLIKGCDERTENTVIQQLIDLIGSGYRTPDEIRRKLPVSMRQTFDFKFGIRTAIETVISVSSQPMHPDRPAEALSELAHIAVMHPHEEAEIRELLTTKKDMSVENRDILNMRFNDLIESVSTEESVVDNRPTGLEGKEEIGALSVMREPIPVPGEVILRRSTTSAAAAASRTESPFNRRR